MKRLLPVIVGIVVFGWMAFAAVFFLAENPGVLGAAANPLREALGLSPIDGSIHHPLRVLDRLRASVDSPFGGLPLEAPGALVFSIWAFAVFLGTGLWITRAVGLRDLPPFEALAVAGALGMGAWGLGVLGLGLAGLLYRWLLVAVLILATATAVPVVREWWKSIAAHRPRRPRGPVEIAAAALISIALLVGLIYALTPAIQSDGLRYHLAAPQAWLRAHRITYLPFNAFTNFPFLIEMLFTLSLAVAGDLAAKMVHFECYLLCGVFVGLLSIRLIEGLEADNAVDTRRVSTTAARSALLAPMVFWTTPTALITAAWEFIDLGTALYFVAMVYALARWHRAGGEADQRRWRRVAALFLGCLIGTKYTMLAMLVVVPAILLIELPSFAPTRTGNRGRTGCQPVPHLLGPTRTWSVGYWVRSSLVVNVVALAVASPWFIKNAVLTGNPVYPLAWGVLGGGEWSDENARFYLAKSGEKGFHPRRAAGFGETLRHLAGTPWEATIHWREDRAASHPGYEDHFLGPLFLLWLPLLLRVLLDVKHRAPREGPFRVVVLLALAFIALWYWTYQSNRLLIPALALLAVLVTYSAAVVGQMGRWLSGAVLGVLFLVTLYNVEFCAEWVLRRTEPRRAGEPSKPSAAAYLLGFQSRDEYLRRAFPPYAMFQLMRDRVGPGEKVLFVGEYRTLHCLVEALSSDWFDTPLIQYYIRATPNNDALLDRLLDEGVAYIFFNEAEWNLYRWVFLPVDGQTERSSPDLLRRRFSPDERNRFEALLGPQTHDPSDATTAPHPRLQLALTESGMHLYRIHGN